MPVQFNNNQIKFALKDKTKLKQWIKAVIEKEKLKLGELSYVFCDDASLLQINQQFLNHNTYTDIITFDYREDKVVNGEIYISIDRVTENAKKFETSFENELHRVMIHGVLHICGYKDKGKTAAALMRKKEDESLKMLGKGKREKKVKDYCCKDMKYHCEMVCDYHKNPMKCADKVIYNKGKDYGIRIHDGGNSFYTIKYCPWCGNKL